MKIIQQKAGVPDKRTISFVSTLFADWGLCPMFNTAGVELVAAGDPGKIVAFIVTQTGANLACTANAPGITLGD
jgi:hypothetical protein